MKYSPRFTYTFTPSTSTLDLSAAANAFSIKGLLAVVNTTVAATLYAIGTAGLGYTALSGGNILTLQASMSGMSATDSLIFFYDDGHIAKINTNNDQAVSLTNPNSILASIYAGVTSYGFLRASIEPHSLFGDTFDGSLDTVNRWTATGTVPPTSATGIATMAPGNSLSASSALVSQPTFAPQGVNFGAFGWIARFENINSTAGTLCYLNSHRFMGVGTQPATWVAAYTGSATTGPLLDAIGFEIDTDGKLYPCVYANGVRVRPGLSFGGTDMATGNGTGTGTTFGGLQAVADGVFTQFGLAIRSDVVFWYMDGLDIPIASFKYTTANYQVPNIQTLPLRYHTINGASSAPSGTMALSVAAVGVGDTGSNHTQIADGTSPWRKARVDSTGNLAMRAAADTGRSNINALTEAVAGAAAADALFSLNLSVGLASSTTMTSYTVPAGKTLRIVSLTVSLVATTTTTNTTRIRLRVNPTGAAALVSNAIWSARLGFDSTTTIVGQTATLTVPFGDGFDIPAGAGVGFSHVEIAANGTIDLSVAGFLY